MYKYGIIETENRSGKAAKDVVLTWLFEENGTLSIFGAGMLPDYKDGQDRPWQEFADQVTAVVIDDGITSVGARTISGYDKLESVKLPDSMSRIGFRAFADCPLLKTVTAGKPIAHVYSTNVASASRGVLKDDTIYIGMQSFSHTPWIVETFGDFYIHRDVLVEYYGKAAEVEVPKGIREIGVSAFENTTVTAVKLPSTLRVIGAFAFNKTGIRAVELPASVRKVDRYAFAQTEALVSVLISNPDMEVEEKAFWNSAVEAELEPDKDGWNSVYRIESIREGSVGDCKKLQIRRDKKKLVGLTTLNCGKAILKKMSTGGPVMQICVNRETKAVEFVQSFIKDGREYACNTIYPVMKDGVLEIAKEDISYLAKWEMEEMSFIGLWPGEEAASGRSWYQAPKPLKADKDASADQGMRSAGEKRFLKGAEAGGTIELNLLSAWLKANPDCSVTAEE